MPSTVKFSPNWPDCSASVRRSSRPRWLAPVVVGIQLVHQHGTMGAAVSGEVALPVTVDVECPHPLRAVNGLLPHPGVHCPPAP